MTSKQTEECNGMSRPSFRRSKAGRDASRTALPSSEHDDPSRARLLRRGEEPSLEALKTRRANPSLAELCGSTELPS